MALQHPAFLNCLSVVDKAAVGNNTVVDGVDRGSVDSMDNGSSVDGVGNNGSVDSVGNDRGVVDSVGNGNGGSGNIATSRGRGVDGLSRVGHVSNKAVGVVSVVGDGLDPAVGKRNSVRATNNTVGITRLRGIEVGLGVVVGDTIGEGVWLRGLLGIFHRGVVCRSRGMVDRGRGVVDRGRGVVHRSRGMVDSWGRSMVGSRSSMDNSMVAMADAVAVSNSVSNVGHM